LVSVVAMLLAVTACETWTSSGRDPAFTSFNPDDTAISAANVSQLTKEFSVAAKTAPVFGVGVGFVGSGQQLVAFDPSGTVGCAGSPRTCQPEWTATVGTAADQVASSPVVDENRVYVFASPTQFLAEPSTLYAFDASGKQGCEGSPKVCSPLWTASVPHAQTWITAADGVVVVASGDALFEFDGAGQQGCSGSPVVCTPVRQTAQRQPFFAAPAISGNRVYVAFSAPNSGALEVYSLDGDAGCSGSPSICVPVWTGDATSLANQTQGLAGASVVDGRVFMPLDGVAGGSDGVEFDANGVQGCNANQTVQTAPVVVATVCQPVMESPALGTQATVQDRPAGAYDRVFVLQPQGLRAYDALATGCTGTVRCQPLYTLDSAFGTVIVANHLAYAEVTLGFSAFGIGVFDADGVQGCSGTPTHCQPIFTMAGVGTPVAVFDGKLFVRSSILTSSGTFITSIDAYAIPSAAPS
jgi:hypothetical protein